MKSGHFKSYACKETMDSQQGSCLYASNCRILHCSKDNIRDSTLVIKEQKPLCPFPNWLLGKRVYLMAIRYFEIHKEGALHRCYIQQHEVTCVQKHKKIITHMRENILLHQTALPLLNCGWIRLSNLCCSLPCPHILCVDNFQPVTTNCDYLLIYLLQGTESFLRS
jgi:hypothetical protein